MDRTAATNTLGFEVSPEVADELSASSQGHGQRHNAMNIWENSYIGPSPDWPQREISTATTASFAALLSRAA